MFAGACGAIGAFALVVHPDPAQLLVVALLVAAASAVATHRFATAAVPARVPADRAADRRSSDAAAPGVASAPQQLLLSKPRR